MQSLKTSYIDNASRLPLKRDALKCVNTFSGGGDSESKRSVGVFPSTKNIGKSKLASKGKVLLLWAIDVAAITAGDTIAGINALIQVARKKSTCFPTGSIPVMAGNIGDAVETGLSVGADNVAFEVASQWGGADSQAIAGSISGTVVTPAIAVFTGAVFTGSFSGSGANPAAAITSTVDEDVELLVVGTGIIDSDIRRYEFRTPLVFVEPVVLQVFLDAIAETGDEYGVYVGIEYTEFELHGEEYRRLLDAYTQVPSNRD